MSEEFLLDTNETSTPSESSNASFSRREPIKVLVIGSRQGVKSTIRTLYSRGFAEVTAWSRLQPTSNPGEVMSVLSRQFGLINCFMAKANALRVSGVR